MILSMILGMEAVLFGLFTIIMMWDQVSSIFENTPYIDRLQNRRGAKRAKMASLEIVFGEPLSWRWLLPFPTTARSKKRFDDLKEQFYFETHKSTIEAAEDSSDDEFDKDD